LLGEFLLPSSNILPRTYQDLHAIMKDIGMEYQSIDACPDDHIIYLTQFMKLPYYKDLKIVHLFDTMHIGKNVTKTLW
jgi:hypothetical protein